MRSENTAKLSVHQLFELEVEKSPNRIAIVHGSETITYAELNFRANRIAHHLLSLGIGPEKLVAVVMERSPDLITCILGILKAGGAYLPLDPEYPQERLAMMIDDANASIFISESSLLDKLPVSRSQIICVDKLELDTENSDNPKIATDANNLAYVMFTSGSTGRPKGVMIEHRSVVRLVKENEYADFSADNVFLQFAPITFDASTFEIWGALLNGARLAIMPKGIPSLADLGKVIHEYGVTTLWLTAGLFHLMVDESIDDLRPLRQLLAGGDVLSVTHVEKVLNSLNCDLINGYGPTENTTFTCCYKIPRGSQLGKSIPIGKPIANTQVYILNEYLNPVSGDEIGEIYIGGDGLARGYLNRDDLTSEKFIASPFPEISSPRLYKTGDLARFLPDGNIEFLGRADNQVKIRGFRIELEEVEIALTRQAGVREAVAVAKEISTADKQLVAFVVLDPLCGPETCNLRKHLEEILPDYMVPSFIFSLDALPLTPNGKVDRAALIKTIGSEPDRRAQFSTPESGTEREIAGILEEVLSTRLVGANDNFFDLGANSLQLARFHSRLQSAFDSDLKIVSLFQNPTVRALAQSLGRNGSSVTKTSDSQDRATRQRAAYARQKQIHEGGI
jgi:aspartate racemase